MLAMPAEEAEKIQKGDSLVKLEDLDIEYNELEPSYDKVIKRVEVSLSV